jgi:hypothetical protein
VEASVQRFCKAFSPLACFLSPKVIGRPTITNSALQFWKLGAHHIFRECFAEMMFNLEHDRRGRSAKFVQCGVRAVSVRAKDSRRSSSTGGLPRLILLLFGGIPNSPSVLERNVVQDGMLVGGASDRK